MNGCISIDRIMSRLDEYLNKNDYISAERHLNYWLSEAVNNNDIKTELLVRNELMGLYRKLSKREQALECAKTALDKIYAFNIGHQVGAATTFLNCATVYKAFGMSNKALPLFEKAKETYEKELESTDSRLGGLYNNMALALVDLKEFEEAKKLYKKAIDIMQNSENGALEVAITYLNMASAAEIELGALEAEEIILKYLYKAEMLIDEYPKKDGYYAFVCEKCSSVFGYYGRFVYAEELLERSRRIYGQ